METLQSAAAAGDVSTLRRLIAAGADVNQPDAQGFLPLQEAVMERHTAAVQLLLAAGADPAYEQHGMCPLSTALVTKDEQVSLLLLEAAPAAALQPDLYGFYPIHNAAQFGLLAVVQRMLQLAPETAVVQAFGTGATPLHCAASAGHPQVVKLLLTAAPHTALMGGPDNDTEYTDVPLSSALTATECPILQYSKLGCIEAARLLLPHTPPDLALPVLIDADELPLFADLVSHWPLNPAQWHSVPSDCPNLARALPAVLARSEAEAAALVVRLPVTDQARLRTLLFCLHRIQQMLQMQLPREILLHILSLVSA